VSWGGFEGDRGAEGNISGVVVRGIPGKGHDVGEGGIGEEALVEGTALRRIEEGNVERAFGNLKIREGVEGVNAPAKRIGGQDEGGFRDRETGRAHCRVIPQRAGQEVFQKEAEFPFSGNAVFRRWCLQEFPQDIQPLHGAYS